MTEKKLGHPDSTSEISVIDLFAGPGGLGEGFSAHAGRLKFNVVLSIEKDFAAHRTLELRSFVRQFPVGMLPDEYYSYVRDETLTREQLFAAYPNQASRAASIAWKAELGKESHSQVQKRIKDALGGVHHWILLGGPPCQAYSVIGRARMKGMEKFAEDHRHTLYREYLKIVASFQPTVFVMENVKGILSSQHNDQSIFGKILADLSDPWNALSAADRRHTEAPAHPKRYKIFSFAAQPDGGDGKLAPEDYILKSERYAVPQKRHRVILLGIRDDYDITPPALEEATGVVTVRDILEGMPKLRSRLSNSDTTGYKWRAAVRRGVDDCTGNSMDRYRGLGTVIRNALKELSDGLGVGGSFVVGGTRPSRLADWLFDKKIGGLLQHETRSHMESDLHRYFFCSSFASWKGRAPTLEDFPHGLLPKHKNAVPDSNGKVSNFADRFRVQLWDDASTTITSHIAKDGHYFIHPDPLQCRSLTVREAARLQTFPDNYFFEGNRTEQYHQIGNAVPPFLAYQLADIVAEVVGDCIAVDRKPATSIRRIRGK